MLGKGGWSYTLEYHKQELSIGRFTDLSFVDDKGREAVYEPPWALSKSARITLSNYLKTAGYFGTHIPDIVSRFGSFKFAHWFILMSDFGVFLIQQSKLPKQYSELFIAMTRMLKGIIAKVRPTEPGSLGTPSDP